MFSVACALENGHPCNNLLSIVRDTDSFRVVVVADNALDLFVGLTHSPEEIDVLLLDISLKGMVGCQGIRKIRENYPGMGIIALSPELHFDLVVDSLQNGAGGFLTAAATVDDLTKAIVEVAQHGACYSPDVTRVLAKSIGNVGEYWKMPVNKRFSSMEIKVMELISMELKNTEISEQIFRSVSTVEAIKRGLLRKTKSKSVVGVVKYAIRHGLVSI